ncbi:MAG: hypothetical protein CR972_04185 [Candidatus Moraniibacteriota bacterium]|nr:MAG: hypothetical protein CR972_04185 [Candidatus Moranbacteria bacterium]
MKKIFITRFFSDRPQRNLFMATMFTLFGGTMFYHFVEKWTFIDAAYFSVITLTTVGYGDMYPVTDAGKIFTMIYILMGVGILFGFINTLYKHSNEEFKRVRNKLMQKEREEQ